MAYYFVFKNMVTGEKCGAKSHALNHAALALGLEKTAKGWYGNGAPWVAWECWANEKPIWHVDAEGHLVAA